MEPKFERSHRVEQSNEVGKDIEQYQNLILTGEQYRDIPFATNKEQRSYIFEVTGKGKKISYFGTSHTNNPEDPLFVEIQEKFKKEEPDIVYIEGWRAINAHGERVREMMKGKSLEEAKREGEPFFTLKLAVDAGVDFESPEPEFSQEVEHLSEKGFSKKDIFRFYVYRSVSQYQRENAEGTLEGCRKYLEPYIKEFAKKSGWDQADVDAVEEEVIAEVDIEDRKKYTTQVDPIPWKGVPQTVVNEIARSSSDFRDRYIFERIAQGLQSHDKIFVVYGFTHAVMQEPAVRALLKESGVDSD